MFERLQHSIKIASIQRKQRRSDARYLKLRKKAKAEKATDNEFDTLDYEAMQDDRLYEDEISFAHSVFLRDQAQRYLVPIPEFDPHKGIWEQSDFDGRWRLVPTEQAKLRSAIRQEKRERWEEWTRWTPLLSSITGLGGVTVAILTLIHKW